MPARQPVPATPEVDQHERLAQALLKMSLRDRTRFLDRLDEYDLAIAETAIARLTGRGIRANPATLASALDPTWRNHRHTTLLAEQFRKAHNGESPRQIWNLPSRLQKTTCLKWGVAWSLDDDPTGRWAYVTYGDTLADEFGVGVRDILSTYSTQLSTQLRHDVSRKDRFLNTDGGGLLCRGVNSGIIGFGVNRAGGLLVDDPMKNWQEAHSATRREHLFNQFTGTLRHRLDDEDAPIIIAHTRWHEDDLTGQLLAHMADDSGEQWEHVCLPALCTDPVGDLLGRALGEPIAPDIFDREQTLNRHRGLVSIAVVEAIEQQHPLPPQGTELKRDWFDLATPSEMPARPDQAITSWDLKLKDKEEGDYVVGQCWWRIGNGYWLVDQIRGQYDHASTETAIALMHVRHPEVTMHHIEAAASCEEVVRELRKPIDGYELDDDMAQRFGMTTDEREAVETLRRSGLSILKPEPVNHQKDVRARTHITPKAERGNVHLPAEAPWVPGYLDEIAAFPNGLHDDQVDATSQALRVLGVPEVVVRGAGGGRTPAQQPATSPGRSRVPSRSRPPLVR